MDCCWVLSTKPRWYLLSVAILIHGFPRAIRGENSRSHSTGDGTDAVSASGWSSGKAAQAKASPAGELEQEDEIKDYAGWRVLRLFPPAQVNVHEVFQALEAVRGVVVLEVVREKSRLAIDVAASPDTSLTELLAPSADSLHPDVKGSSRTTEADGDDGDDGSIPARGGRGRRQLTDGSLEWRMIIDRIFELPPRPTALTAERLAWDNYYRYQSIANFVRGLARKPTVECLTLGYTAHGRPIFALLFSVNARRMAKFFSRKLMKVRRERNGEDTSTTKVMGEDSNAERINAETVLKGHDAEKATSRTLRSRRKWAWSKRIIFIEAGTHAREWIGPAVATYVARQLAEAGKGFVRHVSFVVAPAANPDGYEFSHTNDRLWRKNRSSSGLLGCPGVDLNRNWGTWWGDDEGSSGYPCSVVYRGPSAFSEVETRALGELARVFRKGLRLFVSLHSFGEYVLYPWGHTVDKPHKSGRLKKMAKTIAKHLNRNSTTRYKYGQISHLIYLASGNVDDFMYSLGVPFSYTIELPKDSFFLPPEDILPVAQDFWEAMVCIAGEVVKTDRTKSFCNKRLIMVDAIGSNKTLKAWINKKVPLQEAKDIVRMRYTRKEMKLPKVDLKTRCEKTRV